MRTGENTDPENLRRFGLLNEKQRQDALNRFGFWWLPMGAVSQQEVDAGLKKLDISKLSDLELKLVFSCKKISIEEHQRRYNLLASLKNKMFPKRIPICTIDMS